jgi:hypothetical protein
VPPPPDPPGFAEPYPPPKLVILPKTLSSPFAAESTFAPDPTVTVYVVPPITSSGLSVEEEPPDVSDA